MPNQDAAKILQKERIPKCVIRNRKEKREKVILLADEISSGFLCGHGTMAAASSVFSPVPPPCGRVLESGLAIVNTNDLDTGMFIAAPPVRTF